MALSAVQDVGTKPAPTTILDSKREYLTEGEVERLIRAAENQRDRTMILMAYRHGLRVRELIALQWSQIDLDAGRIRVRRAKGSDDSVQPLGGREMRGLRKLRRAQPVGSRFVFLTRLVAIGEGQTHGGMTTGASHIASNRQHRLSDQVLANTN